MSLLKTINLSIRFGGLKALESLSMEINEGEIVGLIGPNGAGKTTVFNLLTGVYQPTAGSITLDGHTLAGYRPTRLLTVHGPYIQNIRLFKRMTVTIILKPASIMQNTNSGRRYCGCRLSARREQLRPSARELLGVFNMENWLANGR